MLNRRFALGTVLLVSALTAQGASLKLVLFNMTARSDFPGVFIWRRLEPIAGERTKR